MWVVSKLQWQVWGLNQSTIIKHTWVVEAKAGFLWGRPAATNQSCCRGLFDDTAITVMTVAVCMLGPGVAYPTAHGVLDGVPVPRVTYSAHAWESITLLLRHCQLHHTSTHISIPQSTLQPRAANIWHQLLHGPSLLHTPTRCNRHNRIVRTHLLEWISLVSCCQTT